MHTTHTQREERGEGRGERRTIEWRMTVTECSASPLAQHHCLLKGREGRGGLGAITVLHMLQQSLIVKQQILCHRNVLQKL